MADSITLPSDALLIGVIAALLLLGLVQAWRRQSGTTTSARLEALGEELEALRQEHEELRSRVRDLEAPR